MKSRDTKPEILLYEQFRRNGLVVNKHVSSLPGTPDLVFTEERIAVFVNGCHWHRHFNCSNTSRTTRMSDFWLDRFARVICQDARNHMRLHLVGWTAVTAWECEIVSNPNREYRRIMDVIQEMRETTSRKPEILVQ